MSVIVLNTDNTALHTVSVQHAIRMLVREVAVVEESHADRRIGPYPWPVVLRLIRYVKTTFLYAAVDRPGRSAECCGATGTAARTVWARPTPSTI